MQGKQNSYSGSEIIRGYHCCILVQSKWGFCSALWSQRAVLLLFHLATRFLGLLHDVIEGILKTRKKLFQTRHLMSFLGQRKNWSYIVSSEPSAIIRLVQFSFEGQSWPSISFDSLICVCSFCIIRSIPLKVSITSISFSCKRKLLNGKLFPLSLQGFFNLQIWQCHDSFEPFLQISVHVTWVYV